MSDHELVELAQDVDVRCRLHGDFVLRSGAVAHEYFDKYLFEADPVLLRRIVARMVALVPPDTDMLGGLELGGVPLATILSNLVTVQVAEQLRILSEICEVPHIGRFLRTLRATLRANSGEDLRRFGLSPGCEHPAPHHRQRDDSQRRPHGSR